MYGPTFGASPSGLFHIVAQKPFSVAGVVLLAAALIYLPFFGNTSKPSTKNHTTFQQKPVASK